MRSIHTTNTQVWAVTIGGTVLQNQLVKRLPEQFTAQFPEGAALAYAFIPIIADLKEPLRNEVRVAFADSIRVIWQVFTGIASIGLLSSFSMKALPLHTQVDDRWGMATQEGLNNIDEKVVSEASSNTPER